MKPRILLSVRRLLRLPLPAVSIFSPVRTKATSPAREHLCHTATHFPHLASPLPSFHRMLQRPLFFFSVGLRKSKAPPAVLRDLLSAVVSAPWSNPMPPKRDCALESPGELAKLWTPGSHLPETGSVELKWNLIIHIPSELLGGADAAGSRAKP